MMRFLYNLVWPIGLLVFLPRYLVKMFRRGGYRRKFGQRFGIYGAEVRSRLNSSQNIWLHAVSVGEVAIALKLARTIVDINPDARFALTTTTTTGFAFAEKNAPPQMEVMYSPLDFWPVTHSAFNAIRPRRIALVEAEVWPNFVAQASGRKIPLALVNARLSPRSERRFTKFKRFVAPLFRQLDIVCVPEPGDVERWERLGVSRHRIRHTGSVKFDPGHDRVPDKPVGKLSLHPGFDSSWPVLFGGSTHRGEEEILARIFLRLRKEFPQLLLFLAPRHVERAAEVRKQVEKLSLGAKLCSELAGGPNQTVDCLILDKTGELRRWYAAASVVFVGKSLTAFGGQNPVEPIEAGKPVIFGSHMENFATLARELVTSGGAVQVSDETSLEQTVQHLLRDEARSRELVENARKIVDAHRGATSRTASLFLDLKKQ
ncbi:MAG TPA: glycosyltransferase N-terminal domain-containing protein [Chthoniobacterales bacterium]|nr:glycosyltransferase N-terminal domain-containing protein [Chthoniobacterales bacterium]